MITRRHNILRNYSLLHKYCKIHLKWISYINNIMFFLCVMFLIHLTFHLDSQFFFFKGAWGNLKWNVIMSSSEVRHWRESSLPSTSFRKDTFCQLKNIRITKAILLIFLVKFVSVLIILLIPVNRYLSQKQSRDWYVCWDFDHRLSEIKLKQVFLLIKHCWN